MKLTVFLILVGLLQVSASSVAQQISLSEKNIPLEKLFKKLENQTGYTFLYKAETLKGFANVNVEINDATIADVLNKCFENKPLEYLIIDKSIVVKRKTAPATTTVKPTIYVEGTVVNVSGQPLRGVTIKLKGTNYGWTTDTKGQFKAIVVDESAIFQFSFIGYVTKELPVKGLQNPVTITMNEDISKLDEVQVIAYGQTTRRFNVGDQTTVSAKEIEKYPVNNVLSVLQGTVPGMVVSQSTGQAGSSYNVVIRGQNGLSTGSSPLYVVDGIPYDGGGYTSQKSSRLGSNNQAYNALSLINPLDIESIDVLKDAAATSIYGSRGANGVILITTKKGKSGDTRIDVNVYSGISQALIAPQLLNTQQYLQLRREAKKNDNAAILPTDYDLNGTWDTTRYTNWPKLFLKGTGYSTNTQASISGGNNNISYLVSGNYRRTTNVQQLIGGADQTSSLHFNLNTASNNKRFTMQFTGGYTYDFNNIPNFDLSSFASIAPNSPDLYMPDGSLNFQNNTFLNPLLSSKLIARTSLSNMISSLTASYILAKGLKAQATVGYNKQSVNEFLASPLAALSPSSIAQGGKGLADYTWNNKAFWSIEPQLEYKSTIGKGALNVLAGASLQKQIQDVTQLEASGYTNDLLINNISAGTRIASLGSGYSAYNYKYSALYSRASYNWDGKYIIEFSGRYDGSSKFGQDRQYHFFYATGAEWIFSSENFFKDVLPIISFGRIKGSYGTTGNDQLPAYQYLENFSPFTSTNPYQGIPGITPTNLPNPYLSWETVAKGNIGLEIQFLKGRIGLQGNFFRNRTTGILSAVPLSSTTGFATITQNIDAKVQNKGFDLTLNTINIQSKGIVWSTNFIFTRQVNALLSYPNPNLAIQELLNQSVGAILVNRYAGVNPQTGLYQFYDRNGNIVSAPSSSGADQVKTVSTTPQYFGSVSNSITFKGVTLSFLFRGVKQLGTSSFAQILGGLVPGLPNANYSTEVLDHWQKAGDITKFGKLTSSFSPTLINGLSINRNVDAYYGDASYIRLQNASLAYQFNDVIAKKIHLRNLRVYMLGENLATISNYKFSDPETQNYLRISPLRTITFGIQASL
ncbi:SusC/RagA family TonB-linked outer membrane protein [Mucilaginibacter sabulilitoris]|uniref:SusC/RagA family TonB-linked outer membrane protein n=1 Tax=Mucilaginibacter sabulilitoris TaxID=1173583 RepID=A0ABZ0TPL3_9SPHI|nr:SusC/RagA family TonB-linked outer membrane protein [Mucilaginibacter sabulilitoris]WPU94731.1 SusC/RagA family TonB-linked outer membrane protein [Mucilaginibacter sabulilitoris]